MRTENTPTPPPSKLTKHKRPHEDPGCKGPGRERDGRSRGSERKEMSIKPHEREGVTVGITNDGTHMQ